LFLEELLLDGADLREVVLGPRLLRLEALLPELQLGEVDEVAVEVGAVDAGELRLATDGHAAGAAHAGAVDHDRVQRDHRLHAEGARDLRAGPHHREGADRHDEVGLLLLEDLLERRGDEAGLAVGAVVGADDQVVAVAPEAVFPEDEVLVAEADDPGRPIPGLLEGAQLGEDGGDPEASADEDDVADLPDVALEAERPDEVGERVAFLVGPHHLPRRLAERLDDDRDRPPLRVVVGHGEGDPLAPLVQPKHHEMARPGRLRDVGSVDVPEEGHVGELLALDDLVHESPLPGPGGTLRPPNPTADDARNGASALSAAA